MLMRDGVDRLLDGPLKEFSKAKASAKASARASAKSNTSIEHHLLISRITIKEILLEYNRRGIINYSCESGVGNIYPSGKHYLSIEFGIFLLLAARYLLLAPFYRD